MKGFIFRFFLVILCVFLYSPFGQLTEKQKPSLKQRGAIFIHGDEDFTLPSAEEGCRCVASGSGTAKNPYIIENWDIKSKSYYGIRIWETKAHFIIRNISVAYEKKEGLFGGIMLEKVENGRIENVIITGAPIFGISLKESKNNKLIGNNIVNNKGTGISLSLSEGNTLMDNTIKGNGIFGIRLEVSNENVLSGNMVVENQGGGVFIRGYKNVLAGNTVKNNLDDGISADMLRASKLVNNTVCGNKNRGIYLRYSRDITVDGNTICDNGYGIYLEYSQNNLVMNNIFTKNGGKDMVTGTQARKNRFINNTVDGEVKDKASSKGKKEDSSGSSNSGKAN